MAIRPYPSGAGTGDALTTNTISQFAATTSLQLKTLLTDESGSGAAVFANAPTLNTPVLVTPELGAATSVSFPVHANEAAAVIAGLAAGKMYQTATGEIRIKL